MSTDIELRRPPPQIRLLTAVQNLPPPLTPVTETSGDSYVYRTPTAAQHRIPATLTCPPAPMKRRTVAEAACRRKLQFIETVAGEEIESFLRSSYELVAKRRCRCT